jgi:hypothetical protein
MTPHYSPYMMLMMDVVRDLKITPDYQPLVDVIREELRKRWPQRIGIEVSKNLVDAMATIVREIESGKGGFNKSRRKN